MTADTSAMDVESYVSTKMQQKATEQDTITKNKTYTDIKQNQTQYKPKENESKIVTRAEKTFTDMRLGKFYYDDVDADRYSSHVYEYIHTLNYFVCLFCLY